MRSSDRFRTFTAAMILCLYLAVCGAPQAGASAGQAQGNASPATPNGPPGQVTGHVYRADTGAPISKAIVTLNPVGVPGTNNFDAPQSTRSDADGAYTFAAVNPGSYIVRAEHSGFVAQFFNRAHNGAASEAIPVSAGQTASQIDMRLLSSGVISGTVFDEDNQPLEGVNVAAIRLRYSAGGQQQELVMRDVATDDLGNFRLYGLSAGNYFVRMQTLNGRMQGQPFRLSYYAGTATIEGAQRVSVTAGNESSGVRFSVGPQNAYDITGNIIDSAESGGARRYVLMLAGRAGGGSVSTATANADGSFAMRGVPSGDYILTAQAIQSAPAAPGGAPLAQRAMNSGATTVRVAEGDARVNVQIGQSSEVAGRVIVENSTGQSVSGIRVGLLSRMSVSAIPSGNYINATDQNGAFKIQNVPTGNYFFSLNARGGLYLKQVACSGRDYTFQPLTMESGVTVGDCVLTLGTDIGAIKGQVLDGGKPVPNLIVLAIPQLSSLRQMARYTVTGNTNENGEFQISNVIPSDYLVFAVPQDDEQSYFQIEFADRRQQDAERVTVKAGETKGIQLKPGTTQ